MRSVRYSFVSATSHEGRRCGIYSERIRSRLENMGEVKGRLCYIFSPTLNIEDFLHDIYEARKAGEITEENMKMIAQKYPEQESVGPPL